MSASLVYLPAAKTDIAYAHAAYERRQAGLGDRFLEQLWHRCQVIADNPQLYAIIRDGIRAAPVGRFPYVVYYRFENGTIYVSAVLHGHQDPREWMNRG